ncbi:hypothetical protein ABT173_03590 [Streptomyces sp. NPDC001795]|uniref:hypothetical protein n=1 Tax=Streptomyces sp. NPDC001795 TaxID=3154525 RepID=UPI00332F9BAD
MAAGRMAVPPRLGSGRHRQEHGCGVRGRHRTHQRARKAGAPAPIRRPPGDEQRKGPKRAR